MDAKPAPDAAPWWPAASTTAARTHRGRVAASPPPRGGGQAFRTISDRLVFRPRLAPVAKASLLSGRLRVRRRMRER